MTRVFNVRTVILVIFIALFLILQQTMRSTAQSDSLPTPGDWAGTFTFEVTLDRVGSFAGPGTLEVDFQVAEDGKSVIGTAALTFAGLGDYGHYAATWGVYAEHGLFSGQIVLPATSSSYVYASFSGRFVSSTQLEGKAIVGLSGQVLATGDWQAAPVTSP